MNTSDIMTNVRKASDDRYPRYVTAPALKPDLIVTDMGWGWCFNPVTSKASRWVRTNVPMGKYAVGYDGGPFVFGKPKHPESIDQILLSGLTIQAKQ